jgi:hypothetical protein
MLHNSPNKYETVNRLKQEGGDPMNEPLSDVYGKDQTSSLWPEVYMAWVRDWEDAFNKKGIVSTACCGGVLPEKVVFWPIDQS